MSQPAQSQSILLKHPLVGKILTGSRSRSTAATPGLSVYQARAGNYDRFMHFLRYAQTRHMILKDFLPPLPADITVLDVGCGTGICTDVLQDVYPDADIRGLDQSTEMLSLFRERHPHIPAVSGDFNDPDLLGSHCLLKPASYDLILSAGALSEYGDAQAYDLVARLLNERGIFINIGIRKNPIGRLIGAAWGFRPSDPHTIMRICRKAGFSDVSAHQLSWEWFPRTLIDVVIIAQKSGSASFQQTTEQAV